MAPNNRRTLIVGSGCFGLSTALELLKRGWSDVTVIDRAQTLPASDGASNDFNRIVRTSYSDPFYAKLAQDAIKAWKIQDEWEDAYHESGVLVLGTDSLVDYKHKSFLNDLEMGSRVVPLDDHAALRQIFPPTAHIGTLSEHSGYLNRDGGWANAAQGISILMAKIVAMKGKIIGGKNVVELIQQDQKTTGVRCSDGTVFEADLVVLATGSWTGSAFPDVLMGNIFQATGYYDSELQINYSLLTSSTQTVQLTQEEGDAYRGSPVVLNFGTGFYIFPPNDQSLVKMAIHCAGYTHSIGAKNVSTPRTIVSDPETGLRIPTSNVRDLRDGLRLVYPTLAEKPFTTTRLCWYNDSPDGDWVIGYQPQSDNSLLIATGGSGHAYKFLPVLGRLVVDSIEGKLSPDLVAKFAVDRVPDRFDESRPGGVVRELDLSQLCTPDDLK